MGLFFFWCLCCNKEARDGSVVDVPDLESCDLGWRLACTVMNKHTDANTV